MVAKKAVGNCCYESIHKILELCYLQNLSINYVRSNIIRGEIRKRRLDQDFDRIAVSSSRKSYIELAVGEDWLTKDNFTIRTTEIWCFRMESFGTTILAVRNLRDW
ncbi:uncharacterized protein [Coffea arabica]|uniref:Uncharacterized protein n=1 Tax=Coffea arabica TaxID=13443 RepID=A0A6P6X6L6_COFAR|nr:uncharacterized protein LOC113738499 isoform X1 [Coffea arabica]